MEKGNGYSSSHIKRNLDKMGEEFAQISLNNSPAQEENLQDGYFRAESI